MSLPQFPKDFFVTDITNHPNSEIINFKTGRGVFYNSPAPMFVKNARMEFIDCNPAFYKAFNAQPEDILGKTLDGLLSPEERDAFASIDERLLKEGGVALYDSTVQLSPQDIRSLSVNKSAITSPEGKTIGIFGIVIDTTAMMDHYRDTLKSNNELKLLVESNDTFFKLLAHDIRNPIHGCLGLIQLLEEFDSLPDNQDAKEILNALESSLTKLNRLLNSLLIWRKANGQQLIFEPIKANVLETVISAIMLTEASNSRKDIKLKLNVDPNAIFTVDVNMFKTIIRNLVSNAYAYSPKGSYIEVAYYNLEQEFCLQVKDSGIGMSDEEVKNLFSMKNKRLTISSEDFLSHGIGLNLVKEFVEKHQGKIIVKSYIGKGTTFSVYIPKNIQMI